MSHQPQASVAAPRPAADRGSRVVSAPRSGARTGAGGARMLAGLEFATCSDEDFRNYIVGWTFVWSGIIPYTFIAAKVRCLLHDTSKLKKSSGVIT